MTSHSNDTRIDEIADGIFRISTRLPQLLPGGFTFNQFLIRDAEPALFHAGPKGLFPAVRAAVATVLPPERLRYIAYSHYEADECGALDAWLSLAPQVEAVTSMLGAHVFLADSALRPARGLQDGERLTLGARVLRWIDAPHLPHGMDCGYMFEEHTRTLFCGDLFTQPGADVDVMTASDIFAPSEQMRAGFPYAPIRNAAALTGKLASTEPVALACMHGASYRGPDCAGLLRRLGDALERS